MIGGPTGCTGLSELGRRQAAASVHGWRTSTRARRGAHERVAPRDRDGRHHRSRLGRGGATQHCDLCELHPGEGDGMIWKEWRETTGFDLAAEPERPLAPGGESLVSFARRVSGAVDRVTTEHAGRSVAVICHGGVISAVTLQLLGFDESILRDGRRQWLDTANTSLTEWRRDDDTGRWTLIRYNDAAHLEGLSVP
ncbi:MAG: histidine phosphatase family protein [Acidimicrobiales bacterium]